jgi:hypothetical protein
VLGLVTGYVRNVVVGSAGTSPTDGYDAFISYSHALDNKVAPALQKGLQRFKKPWYQVRSMRVFRDTTNLDANPDLWASILAALSASRWFILMASPLAARSPWVEREVGWWIQNRSPDSIIIVLTDGRMCVYGGDDEDGDAALPGS